MNEALKELLFKIADDQLVLGHRNSEWTGLGPMLEEDIAFSSMAQDKIGQSLAFYQILEQLGEADPDTTAFGRSDEAFRNCQMVELPNGEYSFSLVRHFLFDTSEVLRFGMLKRSSCEPLAQLAVKIGGELKYHLMHGRTWIKKLGNATDDSISRLQVELDILMPYALGIFEPSPLEDQLISEGIFEGEEKLKELWMDEISGLISQTQLKIPDVSTLEPVFGGRRGQHTEHLVQLIDEMTEVLRIDPDAEW